MEHRRNREQERQEALRLKGAEAAGFRRCCAWPGCDQDGAYRAPAARDRLREFQWLCLDHVREFNKGWDFFAGMNAAEIEAHRRADFTWHRPSWRFGTAFGRDGIFHDVFGLFGDAEEAAPPRRPRSKAEEMMARLGLDPGCGLEALKRRYKQLAKQHHPDLHGGDKDAEERLKLINEAYTYSLDQRLYA